MKTIMAKTPHDSSFSFSRRYFHWKKKPIEDEEDDIEAIFNFSSSSPEEQATTVVTSTTSTTDIVSVLKKPKKKLSVLAISKFKSAFSIFGPSHRLHLSSAKMVGTLFGYRRGHVHFAFQEDPKLNPTFLVELAMPTSVLVREMASGLVRIALECDKMVDKKGVVRLLDEGLWRTYCNGKKCGFATRRECGPEEWKVLKAVGPVSMGAGVLPGAAGDGDRSEGELMYMRAKFERIVGSKDSEAFYMMNPDGNGGPELSIYLLRV